MAYTYRLMTYQDNVEDVRGIFGVDSSVLSDDVIHRLPNMPAAELIVLKGVASLTGLSESALLSLKLAVLYYTAAACLQAVKTNLLHKESDNKTIGERFKDALSLTDEQLKAKGRAYLTDALTEIGSGADKGPLLTISKPSVDVITGNPYA